MAFLASVVFGYAGGVFARSFYLLALPAIATLLFSALLSCGAYRMRARAAYACLALFLIAAALGVWRTGFADAPQSPALLAHIGERVSYEGRVVGMPDVRDATERVPVFIPDLDAKVLLVVSRGADLSPGDTIRASGTLELPEPFMTETGRVFHYDRYLAARDIHAVISFGFARTLSEAPWWNAANILFRIKTIFTSGIERALPEPYAALASGMVVGGKQGLGDTLLASFVATGLVHIVVLSGYNVMVVADALMAFMRRVRVSKKAGAAFGALAVCAFAFIAGGGAATMRAALMALIALYARASGRTYAASRALLFVAFCMLVFNPLLLAFDPGFGFSIAATAGLIWLAPLIENRLSAKRVSVWKELLAATLAAQIAVLPLILYETGNLSLAAFPANILVLPLVPVAMALTAVAGCIALIAPAFAVIAGFPAYLATKYIIGVAEAAAHLPFARIITPAFSFAWVVAVYALLIVFIISFAHYARANGETAQREKRLARTIA